MTRTAQIVSLAWPMLVGQLAVVANGIVDTVMAGRLSPRDLASVAIGSSAYVTIFVGLMGTLQAVSIVVARHWGAGAMREIGATWRQAVWLCIAMTVPGAIALTHPAPLLALAGAEPAVSDGARLYLQAIAFGLPAALWFRAFTMLNVAIARPRIVMAINLAGPLLKVPLNDWLMNGGLGVPAMGGAGCGLATAIVSWLSAIAGWLLLRHARVYRGFGLGGPGRPDWAAQRALWRLGLPIGLTHLIDVTAFSFMTLLAGRLGTTYVAGHQIVANLAVTLYMVPLALASAASVLTAQALGADDAARARATVVATVRLVVGLALTAAVTVWLLRGTLVAGYTTNDRVAAIASSVFVLLAAYHVFDAMQCTATFLLRAYRVTVVPMIAYAVSLWGFGLGGGSWLAFERGMGVAGFWTAGAVALACTATTLGWTLERVSRPAATQAGAPTGRP